jgi:hypothetical protein
MSLKKSHAIKLQALSFRFAILASGLAMFSLACGGLQEKPGDASSGSGGANGRRVRQRVG